MPVNLQEYSGVVRAFSNCFNHNNIHNTVFHRKPNVSNVNSWCLFCKTYKRLHVSVDLNFLFDRLFQEEY